MEKLDNLLFPYKGKRDTLIEVLQKVQEKYGYISEEAISIISKFLCVSESKIFSVASFFTQFKFTKPSKHNIKVCLGTACHVRGGADILSTFERELKIKANEITPDGKFSLERVACLGCCALAPVVVVNNEVQPKMTSTKVKAILKKLK